MSRATVLVADDSSDTRKIVTYSLIEQVFLVVKATDGHQAIRLARQCRPSLMLLDLCMPGLDGWEVVAQLRDDPALEDMPIVAMTGYDADLVIRAARMAGCQEVLTKPFDFDTLRDTIAGLISPVNVTCLQYAR